MSEQLAASIRFPERALGDNAVRRGLMDDLFLGQDGIEMLADPNEVSGMIHDLEFCRDQSVLRINHPFVPNGLFECTEGALADAEIAHDAFSESGFGFLPMHRFLRPRDGGEIQFGEVITDDEGDVYLSFPEIRRIIRSSTAGTAKRLVADLEDAMRPNEPDGPIEDYV